MTPPMPKRLALFVLAFFVFPLALAVLMATPELFDSGVPRGATDELIALFRAAQTKLRDVVLHPPGGTEAARQYRQAWASQQIAQIDRWIRQLDADAAAWIGENLPQAFVDGINRADKQAREVGVKVPDRATEGSFALIDRGTLSVFARDIHASLSAASASMGSAAKRLLRATAQDVLSEADINRILAGGVIEGRPVDAIRNLREQLRKVSDDEVTVRTKNGGTMNFEVGYYASLVARTRTREATVRARHERLQGLGLDLVSIVGRISNNFCTAYLGEVFSISGRSDKYPPLASLPSGGPPFHPNCSKSTRPFVEALASQTQLDNAEGDDDQASMLNIDPTTAQKRFKELQLRPVVTERYAHTAQKLFGHSSSERPA